VAILEVGRAVSPKKGKKGVAWCKMQNKGVMYVNKNKEFGRPARAWP
jgi:hypothetical protein